MLSFAQNAGEDLADQNSLVTKNTPRNDNLHRSEVSDSWPSADGPDQNEDEGQNGSEEESKKEKVCYDLLGELLSEHFPDLGADDPQNVRKAIENRFDNYHHAYASFERTLERSPTKVRAQNFAYKVGLYDLLLKTKDAQRKEQKLKEESNSKSTEIRKLKKVKKNTHRLKMLFWKRYQILRKNKLMKSMLKDNLKSRKNLGKSLEQRSFDKSRKPLKKKKLCWRPWRLHQKICLKRNKSLKGKI